MSNEFLKSDAHVYAALRIFDPEYPVGYSPIRAIGLMQTMRRALSAALETDAATAKGAEPLTFTYRNWRGEVRVRKAFPVSIRYGVSEWHKESQWLMLAIDAETNEEREFAMQDMACWGTLGNGNFGVT